jgi:uracil-DNA glycosylase
MLKPQFPIVEVAKKLAIVLPCPHTDDENNGTWLHGPAGSLLSAGLQHGRLMRTACYVGGLINESAPGNRFSAFDWHGPELASGLAKLREDLTRVKPNCILLLGTPPLTAAGVLHDSSEFRGTTFICNDENSPFRGYKCVSARHPRDILKDWGDSPLFAMDVVRACTQAEFPDLRQTKRMAETNLTSGEVVNRLQSIPKGVLISFDIEGGVEQGIICVSISTHPQSAFIIPFQDYDPATKAFVMTEFNRIMADPAYPKVLQNSLYDQFVMAWVLKLPVRGIVHDTMLSSWEIYPELPKGLGVQASIWTDQPFYKFQRKIDNKQVHYAYCCTDSMVTLEIHQRHMELLNEPKNAASKAHYEFNMSLLPSLEYMQLRGIRYDREGSNEKLAQIQARQAELQTMAETLAGEKINISSPLQMNKLLYRKLGLEPQYKKENGRKTTKLTSDADALLTLMVKHQHPFVGVALAWRKLEGVRKQLCLLTDADNRMRGRYNLVGADTGRLSSSKSETGSGTNLQTIMEENRMFFLADEGKFFFQCDLSGADGYTVACRAAELGDSRMLDDYAAGVKPAKVIALMHILGPSVGNKSPQEILELLKITQFPAGLYDVCKVVQHGSNYLMGPNTTAKQVLEKSFKKGSGTDLLFIPPTLCKQLQALYFLRYPGIQIWHEDSRIKLLKSPYLSSPSGHTRRFFGRPNDRETLKQYLAHEPQHNTTYVTNRAMLNLWTDPENRTADNRLIIEPLHSVHDALCGQFDCSLSSWAAAKVAQYFYVPLTIGGHNLVIPFEGGYGPSWYHTKEHNRVGEIIPL